MSSRIYLLVTLLALAVVFYRFNRHGQNLPEGCDEFGFLQMSEAISSGKLFEEHTSRRFMPALVEHLEKAGFRHEDYAWAVAPHAYHVEEHSRKIINQYPPGTSFILSVFPKGMRQSMFSVLAFLLMTIPPYLAIRYAVDEEEQRSMAYSLLFLFFTYALISSPMLTEFGRVNSVAPTFGLLLTAGIVMRKRPELAIFLVSLSMIFRIANILIIPPMMIYAVFRRPEDGTMSISMILKRGINAFLAFLLSGFGLYLLYTYILLGNPFLPTYSEIDQRSIGIDILMENVRYYFVDEASWFWPNLVAVILLIFIKVKRGIPGLLLFTLLSMPLICYLYFLFHFIRTPYYPYAPVLLMTGLAIRAALSFSRPSTNRWRLVMILPVLVLCIMGIRESITYYSTVHNSLEEESQVYRNELAGEDVIWAELKSSTVEYAAGVPGMRLQWAKANVIREIMIWLRSKGYHQAILVSDLEIPEKKLSKFLSESGIQFNREVSEDLGIIYRIPTPYSTTAGLSLSSFLKLGGSPKKSSTKRLYSSRVAAESRSTISFEASWLSM